jgi:YqjK-like protein
VKLEEIHAKRSRLIARAADERDEVAYYFGGWERPLAAVDWVLAFVRGLRDRAPLIGVGVTVAAALLAIARPKSIGRWFSGGQIAWRIAGAILARRRG